MSDKAPVAFLEYAPDPDAAALREMAAWAQTEGRSVQFETWNGMRNVSAYQATPEWICTEVAGTIAEAWAALKATEGFPA